MQGTFEATYLQAKQVSKLYGGAGARQAAIQSVDLCAARGEFVAIRGPSGGGKSTLLHILGAMDRPTSGEVWLDGQRLDALPPAELAVVRRRQIGFVFQAFNLLPTLSVLENAALPLLLDGVAESESSHRAMGALAAVGLETHTQHRPAQLSGGEMQRVAIARALAIEPDLIIADEPTGSLDSTNGNRVLELLAELNSSREITVLLATHSEEAAAYAGRTIYLKDGQLVKDLDHRAISATL